ncbi:MAG: B12-binding domain-containing radical SAM protein, partial [Candidatus Aminicenantales bacterium]
GLPLSVFKYELSQQPVPDVVLIGCTMTYWYPGVQQVIEIIRQKWGGVPVILGGIYATLMPEHARRFSGADYIVEGHGEKKIFHLLREILGEKACPSLKFENLEDLPPPAFDLQQERATVPILTSRGCPFNCSFCAGPLLGGIFEQRKPYSVIKEIENDYLKYHTRNIAFYDDALLLNKKTHILPILKEVEAKNLPLAFHTPNGLHIREIDLQLALLFKKTNFRSIFLSQESFEEAVLKESSAKVAPGELEKALNNLEKAGFKRHEINVYLIAGLPSQETSGLKESIVHIKKLGARPRLAYFSPVPGTKKWQEMIKKGYLTHDSDPLLHNKLLFPYLWGNISAEDLKEIKQLIQREVKWKT